MDYGIDVSHWNAITDANAVRAAGITYAWCKATESTTYTDPTFAAKVAQLRAAGIVVGAYHFMRAGDPRAQARHFKARAAAAGCLSPGALLPMLDMEADDVRSSANGAVNAFYDELGVPLAEVYGNLDWWRNVLRPGDWGGRNLLGHVARYNGDPGNPGWSGWNKVAVHQHSSTGRVDGIPGNVDRNATIGSYQLAHLVLGGTVLPPTPAPTTPPAQSGDTWTVRSGDTLSRIASVWGVTVSALAVANNIPNPDLIFVGQVIRRPGSAGSAPAPSAGGRYQIKPGDTLSGIAAANGTTVAVLTALNNISNPDRIYAGEWLTLPGGPAPTPPLAPADRVYTVQAGDTLSAIAARLGYPGGYVALAKRNGITNPNLIHPGQKIHY